MITFWKQKEVFIGTSMQNFSKACSILKSNNIKYKIKINNTNSGIIRGNFGSLGENLNYSRTYYIYVNKSDYDYACSLLHNYQF